MKVSEHHVSSQPEGLASRGAAPETSALKTSRAATGPPRDRGKQRLQSGRAHADSRCTGTQHKAVPPQEPWPDLPVGCGGSPGEAGVTWLPVGSRSLVAETPGNTTSIKLSSRSFSTKTWPGPTVYSVGTSLAKQPARQEHTDSPPISRQDA